MSKVTILNGMWRKQKIENLTFPLMDEANQFRTNSKGMYVKVDPSRAFPSENVESIRIHIEKEDDVIFNSDKELTGPDALTNRQNMASVNDYPNEGISQSLPLDGDIEDGETEWDTIFRLEERFDILNEMTAASALGIIRGAIVSGAPGTGKSYGVEDTLEKECHGNYEMFKGSISPLGLYAKLYEFKDRGDVFVLDDSDSVFYDNVSLGLLKTVLDTSKRRQVSWMSDNNYLKEKDIPTTFEFQGSVIFITNMDLENSQARTLKPHFDALISRTHFLDLTIRTMRDKFLRIKSLVQKSGMLREYGLGEDVEQDILEYMKLRHPLLRELSLRTVLKIADLAKMRPEKWERMCDVTVCRM